MPSTPMRLDDALRLSGYTIDAYEHPGVTIAAPAGPIVVPPMILSRLTWQRTHPAPLGAAFYLDRLPAFHPDYQPVQLSIILDRFRARRLSYDTPDEFGLAVRRWGAVNLGAMSTLTRRYLSTAVDLPLDTLDITRVGSETTESTSSAQTDGSVTASDDVTTADSSESTSKARNASSDFPQGMIAGSTDYASGAVDSVGDGSVTGSGSTTAARTSTDTREDSAESLNTRDDNHTERGRNRSVMELLAQQREAFLNVDVELLDSMEPLFLSVFDRSENEWNTPSTGYRPFGW